MVKNLLIVLVRFLFNSGDLHYLKEINDAISESSQNLSPVLCICRELWFLNTLEQERWGDNKLRSTIK